MNWLFAKRLRSFVLLAGAASLILNLALLMPALYMMQVDLGDQQITLRGVSVGSLHQDDFLV